MVKWGFAREWVKVILTCVTSVSYSFLINGKPRGYAIPSRGLWQGDPISPYLFLLCVEGLSALITKQERNGKLSGIQICDGAPNIHYLLFADDSFLFGKANIEECSVVQRILDIYSQALGHGFQRQCGVV